MEQRILPPTNAHDMRAHAIAVGRDARYVHPMDDAGLVHIVDDDAEVRGGLESLVRSVGNTVRLYASPSEFLSAELPEVRSCLLLDVRLPGTNGLDFQDALRARGIAIPIVLMTGHGDIQMSVRGMKAGAVDFLTKPFRSQDVLDAVAAALSRDDVRRQSESEVAAVRARYETLTPRERQVADLVTDGLLNKQVAGELDLSEVTVKIHRGTMMKKMSASSLPDLVKMIQVLRAAGVLTARHP